MGAPRPLRHSTDPPVPPAAGVEQRHRDLTGALALQARFWLPFLWKNVLNSENALTDYPIAAAVPTAAADAGAGWQRGREARRGGSRAAAGNQSKPQRLRSALQASAAPPGNFSTRMLQQWLKLLLLNCISSPLRCPSEEPHSARRCRGSLCTGAGIWCKVCERV